MGSFTDVGKSDGSVGMNGVFVGHTKTLMSSFTFVETSDGSVGREMKYWLSIVTGSEAAP